jgi:hypothetical protein
MPAGVRGHQAASRSGLGFPFYHPPEPAKTQNPPDPLYQRKSRGFSKGFRSEEGARIVAKTEQFASRISFAYQIFLKKSNYLNFH